MTPAHLDAIGGSATAAARHLRQLLPLKSGRVRPATCAFIAARRALTVAERLVSLATRPCAHHVTPAAWLPARMLAGWEISYRLHIEASVADFLSGTEEAVLAPRVRDAREARTAWIVQQEYRRFGARRQLDFCSGARRLSAPVCTFVLKEN